jgi:hypothetical protein
LNSPRTVVGELLGERRAVLLASLGGGVPLPLPILDVSPATRQALEEFLSQYHGQSVDSWVDPDNKTLRLTTLGGDTLELLSDSRIIVRQTLGTTATQTELKADASISDELAVQMLENNDGHTQMLVTRRNAQTDSALVMDVATNQIISGQTVELGAQGQPLQTTRYTRAQNGTLQSSIHDAGGQLIRQVSVQTFDDGTALEIKTEGGVQHMRSVVLRDGGSGKLRGPDKPCACRRPSPKRVRRALPRMGEAIVRSLAYSGRKTSARKSVNSDRAPILSTPLRSLVTLLTRATHTHTRTHP